MRCCGWILGLLAGLSAGAVVAQAPGGPPGPRWVTGIDGLAGYQGAADLDGGGDMTFTRYFAGVSVTRLDPEGISVGVSAGAGGGKYDFGGRPALWGDTRDQQLSLFLRAKLGERTNLILIPTLKYAVEDGASMSDGRTQGVIGALFWDITDTLTLGPGIGVFTQLEQDRELFPFLAIDWKITPKLLLSTGQGVGATQGPGLTLSYAVTDALRLGIAGRIEDAEFRLDDSGPAPGGVGQHSSFPLVATVAWSPSRRVSASAFAGVDFGGELTLRDAQGGVISREDYDPAPVLGGQFVFNF